MFMIVSPDDTQVYELNAGLLKKEISYIHELIAFASLDLVESSEWTTSNMYIKTVDKFNEYSINCLVTPGRMRFLFIHEGKSDESIKNFLTDSYEYYVKALLNPFLDKNSKIFSPMFDFKIRGLVKKHLA